MTGSYQQKTVLSFSDLHERLEHLVTYSTQLIFVSGKSIGGQQKFVESFLSEQQQDSTVAYLHASEKTSLREYRSQIMTQLVGRAALDFSRPLTELFPRVMGDDAKQIMICAVRAEQMPMELLKELWDLVLQNRFAHHKHHMNILLFAESSWVAQAKSWLPMNSSDKPVLLTAGDIEDEPMEKDTTELEQMLAEKRKQFEQRMRDRAKGEEPRESLIKTWWMKSLIAGLFLLSFSSMIIWQHFEVTQSAFSEFYTFLFQDNPDKAPNLHAPQKLVVQSEVSTFVEIEQEVIQEPEAIDIADDESDLQGQARVTDWKTALEEMNKEALTISREMDAVEQQTATFNNVEVAVTEPLAEYRNELTPATNATDSFTEISTVETVDTSREIAVEDYQVQDVDFAISDTPTTDTSIQFQYHEDGLLGLPQSHYVLQISAMSSQQILEEFLLDHRLLGSVWIYKTQRYGGDWYVVLLNQSFFSIAEARTAANTLASTLQRAEPFAKSVEQIHLEISTN